MDLVAGALLCAPGRPWTKAPFTETQAMASMALLLDLAGVPDEARQVLWPNRGRVEGAPAAQNTTTFFRERSSVFHRLGSRPCHSCISVTDGILSADLTSWTSPCAICSEEF